MNTSRSRAACAAIRGRLRFLFDRRRRFMIGPRSWALISKPASISHWMTISAAASGSGIGTGKSSLSNRSASTVQRGELAHVDRFSPCQAA
jgi:hypothetical protein